MHGGEQRWESDALRETQCVRAPTRQANGDGFSGGRPDLLRDLPRVWLSYTQDHVEQRYVLPQEVLGYAAVF